jgi:predicted Zn-dependent protease
LVVLAGLAAWMLLRLRASLRDPTVGIDLANVDLGETLMHAAGLHPRDAAYRLPIGPLVEAWSLVHLSAAAQAWVLTLFLAWSAVAVYALGAALGGAAWSGWAALAAAQPWMWPAASAGSYKQCFYEAFVVTAAAAAARWARRGGRGAADAGIAIGASLLYRSALAFFPPLLALLAIRVDGRSPGKWGRVAALVLLPYAFLIPWTGAHWAAERRIVLFESSAADPNIIAGVAGTVTFAHGDPAQLVDGEIGGSVLKWALRRVSLHPVDYASGVLRRIRHVLGLEPWLFAAAALAFFLRRRKPAFQALALFASYFILVHCAMALAVEHFQPLWIVLAAVAASGLLPISDDAETRAGRAGLRTALAAAVVCAAAASAVLVRYAILKVRNRAHPLEALEAAAAARPDDGWLAFELGRARLSENSLVPAETSLRRAASLQPRWVRTRLELAWCEALQGRPENLLTDRFSLYPEMDPYNDEYGRRVGVYRAAALLRMGRREAARLELSSALDRWFEFQTFPNLADDRALEDKLRRGSDGRFSGHIDEILADFPRDRLAVLSEMSRIAPSDVLSWLDLARTAADLGDASAALDAMARAEALYPDPAEEQKIAQIPFVLRSLAVSDSAHGRADKALALLKSLTRRRPDDADGWIALAEAAASVDDPALAFSSLDRAAALRPDLAQKRAIAKDYFFLRRLAASYSASRRPDKALALLKSVTRRAPDDADGWIALAEVAADSGDSALALSALDRAEALRPDPTQKRGIAKDYFFLRRLAGTFAAHGRAGEAKALLTSMTRRAPDDADAWIALAAAAADLEDPALALSSLDRAEALRPDAAQKREIAKDYFFLRRLAAAFSAHGRADQALTLLSSLTRRRPEDVDAWIALGAAAAGRGDAAAALGALARAQSLRPDRAQTAEIARADAALVGLAATYSAGGRADEALALLKTVVVRLPGDAGAWLALASAAADLGDSSLALSALTRAEKLRPDAALSASRARVYSSLLRLAETYAADRRADEALALLNSVALHVPDDADAWIGLASAAARLAKSSPALSALAVRSLDRAELLKPTGGQRHRIALVSQELGLYRRAVAILDELVAGAPEDDELLGDRGVCRSLMGDDSGAIADLSAAIKLAPKKLSYALSLGSIDASLHREDDAAKVYDAALAADPEPSPLRDAVVAAKKELAARPNK